MLRTRAQSERGSALLLVLIIMIILVGISFAYMTLSYINTRKVTQEADAVQALFIAESAAGGKICDWNSPSVGAVAPSTKGSKPVPNFLSTLQPLAGGAYLIPPASFVNFGSVSDPLAKPNPILPNPNLISLQVITWYPMPYNSTTKTWDSLAMQAYANTVNNYYLTNPTAINPPPPPNKEIIMRKVDVLVSRMAGGVYWNAVYAGNSSNALYNGQAYSLNFGGSNGVGDQIWGNIYSGGNITAGTPAGFSDSNGNAGGSQVTYNGTNNSTLSGTYNQGSEAALAINRNATTGQTSWEQSIAQLGSGNRDPNTGVAYIDVKNDLASKGAYGSWVDGSSATQITDPNQPSHIFRENPTSDYSSAPRTQAYEYAYSGKNDFYLEDPTNSQVTHQSLSGVPVNGDTTASALNVNQNGNNAVYFIDGNLRVSGEPIKSYQLTPTAGTGALKMTMVVKGNVSMTDNVLYPSWQSKTDSLAIIAIQDPAFPNTTAADFARSGGSALPSGSGGMSIDQWVSQYNTITQKGINNGSNLTLLPSNVSTWTPQQQELASQEYNKMYGSGNVYFGDPGSGTVEHFEGYLYAENNFYATDLNSTTSSGGTKELEIFGNMTAGNQIKINRGLNNGLGQSWIPLNVKFDDAIKTGSSTPPGLPPTPGFGSGNWAIAASRQAP
jgi:hypothetical protein